MTFCFQCLSCLKTPFVLPFPNPPFFRVQTVLLQKAFISYITKWPKLLIMAHKNSEPQMISFASLQMEAETEK